MWLEKNSNISIKQKQVYTQHLRSVASFFFFLTSPCWERNIESKTQIMETLFSWMLYEKEEICFIL